MASASTHYDRAEELCDSISNPQWSVEWKTLAAEFAAVHVELAKVGDQLGKTD